MPSRSIALSIALFVAVLACGCVTDGSNSLADAAHQTAKALTPKPVTDTPGDKQPGDEQWDQVGESARKNRPVEHENDPLRGIFVSDRAQEIEKSLGVEN